MVSKPLTALFSTSSPIIQEYEAQQSMKHRPERMCHSLHTDKLVKGFLIDLASSFMKRQTAYRPVFWLSFLQCGLLLGLGRGITLSSFVAPASRL